jgi:predicted SprT family Zn-dependent metalloprotease
METFKNAMGKFKVKMYKRTMTKCFKKAEMALGRHDMDSFIAWNRRALKAGRKYTVAYVTSRVNCELKKRS